MKRLKKKPLKSAINWLLSIPKTFKRSSKTSLPQDFEVEPRLRQIITPVYSVIEEKEGRNAILQFISHKQYQMVEDRFNSPEGELFRAFWR